MLNKKQRIILSVTNDLVIDNRMHKMCMSLHNAGYSVLLVGRQLSHSRDVPETPYKTKRIRLLFSRGALFYACFNIRLFFVLLCSRADVFTANDLDTLLAVFVAAKIRRKKIVYDSHEYFTEVPELADRPFQKKTWQFIESYIFPKLSHCITVCESIAAVYSQKYSVSVHVVRNVPFTNINTNIQVAPVPGVYKPYIVYQGAINVGRGLEMLIESMRYVDDYQLVIIGSGNLMTQIQKQIAEADLTDTVICM
ncbi:MAG: glycosyltransferase, partial [Bacteroidales bacterium]